MSVLDASAYAEALVSATALGQACRDRIGSESTWSAPAHLPAEVQSALRGLVLAGKLTPERADDARRRLRASRIQLFPFAAFERRVWQLRDNLTTYDAWYVALAERLNQPLVSSDSKFKTAAGPRCTIELVASP